MLFNHLQRFGVFLGLALLFPGLTLADAERERIGLVLAGGGARGIAHAGLIRALEEMQIPVDAVAGTSMGALVGGLYASGRDADDLYHVISTLNWNEAFEDSIDRTEFPLRRKGDDYDYASQLKVTLKDGSISTPLGMVQGQQTRQLIKDLMLDASHIRNFDNFPIPYRAVATDIETGEAYVFSDGNVVTAMRASMSLPALLAPVNHNDRLLVDGGLALNIPVEIGLSMDVDRLIVVDIGTPLRSLEEIDGVLAVTDQMVGFLTRRNSEQSLKKMRDGDILVNPDLEGIGMLDFEQAQLIYQRGYEAGLALREQLSALSVDERTWHNYLASRVLPHADNPPVAYIAIHNDSPVSDEVIRLRIRQELGQPLDRQQLLDDIASIYALDYWEIIDYEQTLEAGNNGVVIKARAKAWGENKLRPSFNLISDLEGTSDVTIGGSYLLKGVNELGGELYGRAQVGDTTLLSGELYQPLDYSSRYFISPYLGYLDHDVISLGPEYDSLESVGRWRVRRAAFEVAAGANLFNNSQLRLALFRRAGEYKIDASVGGDFPDDSFQEGGILASYLYDTLDDAYFPTRGGFLYAEYELNREDLWASSDFERWRAITQSAFTFGREDRNTVILTARTGQSIGATNEPQNYYQLGGLFNLSGHGQNLFSGRQMAFAMAQYQRKTSDDWVLPVDLPVYLGISLEGGRVWSDRSDVDFGDLDTAGSLYLAVNSPLGPFYVAYGRAEGSESALYLSLGWPFLSNQSRLGR